MRRPGLNLRSDTELIHLWVSERYVPIVQIVENSLRHEYRVVTATSGNGIHTYAYDQNGLRGSINIGKMLVDIVLFGGRYDRKLRDPVYSTVKAHGIINSRIFVAKAAFGQDSMNAICDLSRDYGVRVNVVRRL